MSEGETFPTSITINLPYEDVHTETDKNSDESDSKAFENVHCLPRRILLSSCSTNIEIVDDAQNFISILEKRSIIATSSKGRQIRKELRILENGKAVNFQEVNVPIPEQPNDNVLLKYLLNPIIPFNKFSPDEFLEVIVYKIKLYFGKKRVSLKTSFEPSVDAINTHSDNVFPLEAPHPSEIQILTNSSTVPGFFKNFKRKIFNGWY
ncbi:hypothetical protein FQA39_LY12303 [Lamprigera yunnana]|nr:hypothetical protein FQA39_LY12303 [Lamprigera yunnana]